MNSVWFYAGAPDGVPGNIPDFSNEAWKNGWLRKFVQDVVFTWRCVLPDPCDCNPACFPNDYYLDNISYGTIIEVFP